MNDVVLMQVRHALRNVIREFDQLLFVQVASVLDKVIVEILREIFHHDGIRLHAVTVKTDQIRMLQLTKNSVWLEIGGIISLLGNNTSIIQLQS